VLVTRGTLSAPGGTHHPPGRFFTFR
jgi:hypothetical protein